MLDFVCAPWRDQFTLSRDLELPGEREQFFAQVRKGAYVPVLRGVYVTAQLWSDTGVDERYLMRVHAAALRADEDLVFSHHSALALWRLPWVGRWPTSIHVTQEIATGGRSNATFSRHTVGVPKVLERIDGLTVTMIERTVVDIARTSTFAQAVVVADAALRRTTHPSESVPRSAATRETLFSEMETLPIRHGTAKIRAVIDFADGKADRPGESLSRVNMRKAHLPAPQLQVKIRGASGREWIVDFYWPTCRLVGEFDGEAKYTDPVFLRGRTPQRALMEEKEREDDIRAAGYGLTRWGWDKARSPILLRNHLVAAGLQ